MPPVIVATPFHELSLFLSSSMVSAVQDEKDEAIDGEDDAGPH
jgi:hypothetical protein